MRIKQITDFSVIDNLTLIDLMSGSLTQGNWNANTNTPDITSTTTTGHYWIVSVAGNTDLDGITVWEVNDWAIKTNTGWTKIDNTDNVLSVNGETGTVVLNQDDILNGTTYVQTHNNFTDNLNDKLNGVDYNADASIFEITDFNTTPASVATITLTSDLRNNISKYDAIKYLQIRNNWAANTSYTLNTIIIPTTENGYQYICTVAGTSNNTEGEPIFPLTYNSSITETDGVEWQCIPRYDYGIVESITDNLLTISGNILRTGSAYITELYYIPFNKILVNDFYLTSESFADAATNDVLDKEKAYRLQPKRLMVAMVAKCHTADTGTDSTIVINDGTNDVFSSDVSFVTGKVENWSGVTVNQKYNLMNAGYTRLDVTSTGNGDIEGAILVSFAIPLNLIE